MSRVYGEPVNVQARDDGRPARFVWGGRLYTVRAILEHWVVNREWWQDPGVLEPEPGPHQAPGHREPPHREPPHREPPHREPARREPVQPELEFWRVEASPGQGLAAGAYELRRDAAAGAWMLRPR